MPRKRRTSPAAANTAGAKPAAAKPARPARTARRAAATIEVVECHDLTEQEAGAYGQLYVAKIGDWTSERRTTEARARAEVEAHLASLADPDPDDGA